MVKAAQAHAPQRRRGVGPVRAEFSVGGESPRGDMSPSNLGRVTRDREFEPGFLQGRGGCEPGFLDQAPGDPDPVPYVRALLQ
jgi:hypothetical protein